MATEILFIDARVADYQSLIAGAGAGTEVVVLDAAGDGVAQIAAYLAGRTGIDAIHLVSHGAAGSLLLGTTVLNSSNLDAYADELSSIGNSLAGDGDFLLYGCDVGAGLAGAAFIQQLAQLTGADVAASTDATGGAAAGGDWVLESSTGAIESSVVVSAASQEAYFSLLAGEPAYVWQLTGANGFKLDGVATSDISGWSVSNAGDVDGDGYDDVIVGAPGADPNGATSGASYVVFGKASGFSSDIALSTLDGSNGFKINGVAAGDNTGHSVSSAGDVNGDGYDDLFIGATGADSNGSASGSGYVVFGGTAAALDALHGTSGFNLVGLSGATGFRLNGGAAGDIAGYSVSSAGDVNGDGFDDLIIGAPYQSYYHAGSSYVVFGKASGFSTVTLSALDGATGFRLAGMTTYGYYGGIGDYSGWSVSGAGDINGDGFDDLVVGAPKNRTSYYATPWGASYVVFGKAAGFASSVELSALNGGASGGFRISSTSSFDFSSGRSVSGAGDVNGDGYDDLIIGAPYADPHGSTSTVLDLGASYVMFGKPSGFSNINLSSVNAYNGTGFSIHGAAKSDYSGTSVSNAGDINGDGFDDVLVGAWGVNAPYTNSGATYVVFGRADFYYSEPVELSSLSTAAGNGFRVAGNYSGDRSGRSVSAAGDINGDGFDDLIIGAPYAGSYAYYSYDPPVDRGASYVVFGGNFTGSVNYLGTSADNTFTGGAGAEIFVPAQGNDTITGGGGADVFRAGSGNDRIQVSSTGFASVDGGSGTDTLALTGTGLTLNLTALLNKVSGIEAIDLTGTGGNTLAFSVLDLLDLSDTGNTLTVDGGADDQVTVEGAVTRGKITTAGYDTYAQGNAILKVDSDIPITLNGTDNLNELLTGTAGADTLTGAGGDDTLDGAGGVDRASYAGAGAAVTVSLANTGSQNTVGAGADRLSNIEDLEGSAFADALTGDANANRLVGLAGNDTLNGGAGNDTLDGTSGTDRASYADAAVAVTVSLALGGAQNTVGAGTDTLLNIDDLEGGGFADTLTGDANANRLVGLGGNDTLTGLGGDDTLDGTSGTDRASYAGVFSGVTVSLAILSAQNTVGAGTDTLLNIDDLEGGGFADTLTGDANANRLIGLGGNDTLTGGLGDDTLDGTTGTDRASYGNAGSAVTVSLALGGAQNTVGAGTDTLLNIDELEGSAFADALTGDGNANLLVGLAGNDTLAGGDGDDTLDGATGTDRASYGNAGSAVTVSLAILIAQNTAGAGTDTLINIDDLEGSAFADALTGDANANRLFGLAEKDTLTGGAGDDTLVGGDGDDILTGGAGDDTLDGTSGADRASYADAGSAVTVSLAILVAQNTAGAGTDTLLNIDEVEGSGFKDTLIGDANANRLFGLADDDTLTGGAGDDTLIGGDGNDNYIVENAGDVVVESVDGEIDFVFASVSYALSNDIEIGYVDHLTLTGADDIDGTGNDQFNIITGNSGANRLDGGGNHGDDEMAGRGGNDTYVVDAATDVVREVFNEGVDIVEASVSYALPDSSTTYYVENLLLTGVENIDATGNQLANAITGNPGHNHLIGLDGNDSLDGVAGNDWLEGRAGFDSLIGGDGDDSLDGGLDADTLIGGAGNDTLDGGPGADSLLGGDGNDTYIVDNAGDAVVEYPDQGSDLVMSGLNWTLGDHTENLTLTGAGAINGTGNALPNQIHGNNGDNVLQGLDGDDALWGEGGADTMAGGFGDDLYYVTSVADVVTEIAGQGENDRIYTSVSITLPDQVERVSIVDVEALFILGNASNNVFDGSFGADFLDGAGGDDDLNGLAGNDTLNGGSGQDTLAGGLGDDKMTGGSGNDTYFVDSLGDVVVESAGALPGGLVLPGAGGGAGLLEGPLTGLGDLIVALLDYSLELLGNVENLRLAGTATEGTGNTLANVIEGNELDNELTGLGGADSLVGWGGNDTLDGGQGIDTLVGGAGDDTHLVRATVTAAPAGIVFVADVVTEVAAEGVDTVYSNSSFTLSEEVDNLVLTGAPLWRAYTGTGNEMNNTLTGQGAARQHLYGEGGADTLDGGAGRDLLDGGAGDDVLVYDALDTSINGGAGTDTLTLAAGGVNLNLAGLAGTVIQNVEVIDLTGSGDNTLTLSASDVLAISSTTETLRIDGNAGDAVSGSGWTPVGQQVIGLNNYNSYTQGLATLLVDTDVAANF